VVKAGHGYTRDNCTPCFEWCEYGWGARFKDGSPELEALRLQLEKSDKVQGFAMVRSLSDAGGHLGCYAARYLRDEHGKLPVLSFDCVDGMRDYPSGGSQEGESFNLAQTLGVDHERMVSAVVSKGALYAHPARADEAGDTGYDADDRVLCAAISGVLAACSAAQAPAAALAGTPPGTTLDALLAAAAPGTGTVRRLASLSFQPRSGAALWSVSSAWGKGSLSPWSALQDDGGCAFDRIAGSATVIGVSQGKAGDSATLLSGTPPVEAPGRVFGPGQSDSCDFVATLSTLKPSGQNGGGKWIKHRLKRFKAIRNKCAFLSSLLRQMEYGEITETESALEFAIKELTTPEKEDEKGN
jgi:hypothetical protein